MRKSQKMRDNDNKTGPRKGRPKSKPVVKGGAGPKRERKRERKGGY